MFMAFGKHLRLSERATQIISPSNNMFFAKPLSARRGAWGEAINE
jgi:hypothetical protein